MSKSNQKVVFGIWMQIWFVAIGIGLFGFAYMEYRVSQKSGDDPLDVQLVDLENGWRPDGNYLKIGEHYQLWNLHYIEISSDEVDEPDPRVRKTFYPIVSMQHESANEIARLIEAAEIANQTLFEFCDENDIALPAPEDFTVLVQSDTFDLASEVPSVPIRQNEVQGMTINSIRSLRSDEIKLIRESFPTLDLDQILILEEGREPNPALFYVAIAGGAIMVFISCAGAYFNWRINHPVR